MSVGLAGNILCVVNKDEDPDHPGQILPDYTSFRVTRRRQLTPIPDSTVFDDLGSDPSQALVSPDGGLLFGADFLGACSARSGSRRAAGSFRRTPSRCHRGIRRHRAHRPCPSGWRCTRRPQILLYVDFVTISQIGVYRYNNEVS